ncbi:MAG: endonuclease/exonuclease/phosphatase family protein [Muribaculaceae bacterium]|nr:endonuclease/exonuclease/phosphatase family protein [Muribaculaceae bacterium]
MKHIARLIAILASFALLFAAYGGRVDPNIWTLPSLATLALPAVAIVALVLLILLAVFRQWQACAVIFGALLLSWPTLRLIAPVNLFNVKADPEKTQLSVLTMNVEEFNWQKGDTKPNKSLRYILDQDADIVVIQEGLVYFPFEKLKNVTPMLNELYKKYPYRKKHYYDVGIISKYPFIEVESPVLAQDTLNYFIKAWDVDAPGGELRVVNMHLSSLRMNKNDNRIIDSMNKPSGRKNRAKSVLKKLMGGFRSHVRQAQAVRRLLDDTAGDVLVMGDMNETPGSYAYRTLCGDDMRDAWADAGLGPTYTFHNNHLYVKIDHILYRGDMKVLSCRRDKEGESDHYPLVAVFQR